MITKHCGEKKNYFKRLLQASVLVQRADIELLMRTHGDSEDLGPSSDHLSQVTESKSFRSSKSVYSSVK